MFGLLRDPESLHAPFVDQNLKILTEFEEEIPAQAAASMETYLN